MCPPPPPEEDEVQEAVPLTAEERETLRAQKLTEKKLRIAMLGSAIISDPNNNVTSTFYVLTIANWFHHFPSNNPIPQLFSAFNVSFNSSFDIIENLNWDKLELI